MEIKCPHCGTTIDATEFAKEAVRKSAARGGAAKTPAKQAASRENGKKGGRPRILNNFSVNAMKDGKFYVLEVVPLHVLGSGEKAKYRLMVCHDGGAQTDAKYQPRTGRMPDIVALAEKNGFEVISHY